MDEVKRAAIVQHLAYEEARSIKFLRKREREKNRNKKIAAICARMREAIRNQ